MNRISGLLFFPFLAGLAGCAQKSDVSEVRDLNNLASDTATSGSTACGTPLPAASFNPAGIKLRLDSAISAASGGAMLAAVRGTLALIPAPILAKLSLGKTGLQIVVEANVADDCHVDPRLVDLQPGAAALGCYISTGASAGVPTMFLPADAAMASHELLRLVGMHVATASWKPLGGAFVRDLHESSVYSMQTVGWYLGTSALTAVQNALSSGSEDPLAIEQTNPNLPLLQDDVAANAYESYYCNRPDMETRFPRTYDAFVAIIGAAKTRNANLALDDDASGPSDSGGAASDPSSSGSGAKAGAGSDATGGGDGGGSGQSADNGFGTNSGGGGASSDGTGASPDAPSKGVKGDDSDLGKGGDGEFGEGGDEDLGGGQEGSGEGGEGDIGGGGEGGEGSLGGGGDYREGSEFNEEVTDPPNKTDTTNPYDNPLTRTPAPGAPSPYATSPY